MQSQNPLSGPSYSLPSVWAPAALAICTKRRLSLPGAAQLGTGSFLVAVVSSNMSIHISMKKHAWCRTLHLSWNFLGSGNLFFFSFKLSLLDDFSYYEYL